MKKKEQEFETLLLMAELVRVNSEKGKLTKPTDFTLQPFSLPGELVEKHLKELKTHVDYQDIVFIQSTDMIFLYSNQTMTKNYAKLLIRVETGNLFSLIAETVRDESRIYPRPTDVRLFAVEPFNIPTENFANILQQMGELEEYQDIKEVKASNGAPYLYSDQYLSTDHAIALSEWVEVIQKEIP